MWRSAQARGVSPCRQWRTTLQSEQQRVGCRIACGKRCIDLLARKCAVNRVENSRLRPVQQFVDAIDSVISNVDHDVIRVAALIDTVQLARCNQVLHRSGPLLGAKKQAIVQWVAGGRPGGKDRSRRNSPLQIGDVNILAQTGVLTAFDTMYNPRSINRRIPLCLIMGFSVLLLRRSAARTRRMSTYANAGSPRVRFFPLALLRKVR